jgi:hypothetical protein
MPSNGLPTLVAFIRQQAALIDETSTPSSLGPLFAYLAEEFAALDFLALRVGALELLRQAQVCEVFWEESPEVFARKTRATLESLADFLRSPDE